jgi:hypothetical protein
MKLESLGPAGVRVDLRVPEGFCFAALIKGNLQLGCRGPPAVRPYDLEVPPLLHLLRKVECLLQGSPAIS